MSLASTQRLWGHTFEAMVEEGEDHKAEIERSCKPSCVKQLMAYQACTKRIEGKHDAHCTGQYFDYWHCIDKCAAPRIFAALK